MDVNSKYSWFRERLKKAGDSKRATGEKKYLKSPWKFYGVTAPQRHKIVKDWFRKHRPLQLDEAEELAEKLWAGNRIFSTGRRNSLIIFGPISCRSSIIGFHLSLGEIFGIDPF